MQACMRQRSAMSARKRKLGSVRVVATTMKSSHAQDPPGAKTAALVSRYFTGEEKNGSRLGEDFFNQPGTSLAKAFLGKLNWPLPFGRLERGAMRTLAANCGTATMVLVRRLPGGMELRGRVVETEAYLGGEDKASHSSGGKRTERNTAMFMKPGTIYVYQIYGIYQCMNISSRGEQAFTEPNRDPPVTEPL
ncbi:DNA-3-methyladenine glycosylase-like isoform X1 [Polyodon spathula]|uniref:DNA-3-methyladenine glycosylase-like isoform X1 n=1 Tax=Polyodon spathula TaxID=7913 RepID=UPI001B7EF64C|nr:DNA-3-methyladenine glycosylase-like isoform X1 [Polyodon spathula]